MAITKLIADINTRIAAAQDCLDAVLCGASRFDTFFTILTAHKADVSIYTAQKDIECVAGLYVFSMYDVMPLLEELEMLFDGEFTSTDVDSGSRVFALKKMLRNNVTLHVALVVTPRVGEGKAACRLVQVGMSTPEHISAQPIYKIVCDEGYHGE